MATDSNAAHVRDAAILAAARALVAALELPTEVLDVAGAPCTMPPSLPAGPKRSKRPLPPTPQDPYARALAREWVERLLNAPPRRR